MRVATPTCASFIELCGCGGETVHAGACFYADGYASAPVVDPSGPCDDPR